LWFDSPIDSPLMTVPSVWLGDTLLLPLLNYRIVEFFKSFMARKCSRKYHQLVATAAFAFILSLTTAGFIHYMWTQDQYLGFIDSTYGALSFAGWWHLAFTVLQMALVITFILHWRRAAFWGSGATEYQLGSAAWQVFYGYSFLSVADFFSFHVLRLPLRPVHDYSWHTAWQGSLVIPFGFLVRTHLSAVARRTATLEHRVPPICDN